MASSANPGIPMRTDQPGRPGSPPPPRGTPDPSPVPDKSTAEFPEGLGTLGGFRLVRELGRGGMGVVYEAEDMQLGRKVAIKCMLPDVASKPHNRQRFFKEARATAAVEHENVIPIHHIGEEDGVPYLVMPLLKGETLAHRLRRERKLPIPEVVRIAKEMGRGLLAAHLRGLIHRDVKPENVWLEEGSGRVKLLDFGIARIADNREVQTRTGDLLGTPGYMAPEQLSGGHDIDARADLFSLGCVLYEAVTGHQPFSGPNFLALLASLASHAPPPPHELNPDTPPALSQLIQGLIAKSPDRRPRTAADVLEALDRVTAAPADPLPAGLIPPPSSKDSIPLPEPPPDPPPPVRPRPPVMTLPNTFIPMPPDDSETKPFLGPDSKEGGGSWKKPPPSRRWVWVAIGTGAVVTAASVVVVAIVLLGDLWNRPKPTESEVATKPTNNGTGPMEGGTSENGGVAAVTNNGSGGSRSVDTKGTETEVTPPPDPKGTAEFRRGLDAFLGRNGQTAEPKRAAVLFREAADLGHPGGQYWLGELYRYGYNGVPMDEAEARQRAEAAAAGGYPPAQLDAGRSDALPAVRRLAQDGDPAARIALARWHLRDGPDYDLTEAETQLDQAARSGHPGAAYLLSRLSVVPNYPRLDEAGQRGHAEAQWELARDYAAGWYTDAKPALAKVWMEKAARQGHRAAMVDLGLMHERGRGTPVDLTKAYRQYEEAHRKGSVEGTFRLGRAKFFGMGTTYDPIGGLSLLRGAAESGHPLAAIELGLREYFGQGQAPDKATGVGRIRRAFRAARWYAGTGDPTAMVLLGCVLEDAVGAPKDVDEAVRLYNVSADRGELYGLYQMGYAHLSGIGPLTKNVLVARNQLEDAARKGFPLAQLYFATKLDYGKLDEKDREQTTRWARAAADAGLPGGYFGLGRLTLVKDRQRAEAYFSQAADGYKKLAAKGDPDAQFHLGYLYEHGYGVKQNLAEAEELYKAAAEQGNAQAKADLARLRMAGEGPPKK